MARPGPQPAVPLQSQRGVLNVLGSEQVFGTLMSAMSHGHVPPFVSYPGAFTGLPRPSHWLMALPLQVIQVTFDLTC